MSAAQKLLAFSHDAIEITMLQRDIRDLKTSLAEMQSKLESSDNIIGELRAEVVLLRNAVSLSRLPDDSNVNKRRGGARNASISSFESAILNASPTIEIATPVEVTTCISTSTPKLAYAAVAAANKSGATQAKQKKADKQNHCESYHSDLRLQGSEKEKCDKEGFTKVEKKKRKPTSRNQCGTALTGPNHLLRPAVPTTLLYVSRLHYSTKAQEIVEYIRVKTNSTLRVERLESRHNVNFNSFVVRVPTEQLSTFMKEEFWPRGVAFRRFRGRLPDTARHTTPTPRVI